jgi:hypothetical protein
MGASYWSDDFYKDKEEARKRSGVDAFAYHKTTVSKPVSERKVHAQMDPKGVTRESRDSENHPASLAIGVILDETGSMRTLPERMREFLPQLMARIESKGVKDSQILFGAVGDADMGYEAAPLQIGQFESGTEMADDLSKIYMEGNGGGTNHESYQNVLYFFARHTSVDCFEKRGHKGFLFIVGDEHPYAHVSKAEVERLMGDHIQADIPTAEIVRECAEKYEIFFVIPRGSDHYHEASLHTAWRDLLGQDRVILLESADSICEVIASAVSGQETVSATSNAKSVRL